MDADAKKLYKSCHGCQAVSGYVPSERMAFPLSGPWQDCAADILDTLPSGENLLVVVDYCSIHYGFVILRSITSAKIIESLKPIFSHPAEPYKLKTDDCSQFVSEELNAFLAEGGTEHRTTWSQANGVVEHRPYPVEDHPD